MKKAIILWLISLLSSGNQKDLTDDMLKACYPDYHLHHNPMKKEKIDESNRSGASVAQEAQS